MKRKTLKENQTCIRQWQDLFFYLKQKSGHLTRKNTRSKSAEMNSLRSVAGGNCKYKKGGVKILGRNYRLLILQIEFCLQKQIV